MIDWFRGAGLNVGDNQPYDARSMWGTTVNVHGDARRLPNVLLEIRHDLIDSDEKSDEWAKKTGDCLKTVLEAASLDGYYDGPQHDFEHDPSHPHYEARGGHARNGD